MGTKDSVLIIDDDPSLRKTLSDILRAKGYAPVAVATGQAALDQTEEERPAVALIDLRLEDTSGLEVMGEIKRRCPGTECIVLTGYASQTSAIEAVNLGAYSYVQKPYDMAQLLMTIRRAVEKREAEKALRFLSSVAEQVTDAIVVTNTDFEITYINKATEKLYGYSQEELIGKNLDILNAEARAEQIEEDTYETVSSGKTWTGEYLNRRKDGSTFTCEFKISFLVDEQGQTSGYIVIQRDITERKRAEEALRQYTERLRILHAIDGAILAAWSPNATAQAALRHVRRLVPCQRASVVVFDLEAHEAKLIAAHVNGETTVSAGANLSPEDFGDIQSLQRGRPYLVEDILTLPHPTSVGQTLSDEGVRSHMMLPLITHGELIGILNLGAESPSAFVPEHVDIARELADQLAIAIQQVRLHEQVQRHAEELEQRVAGRTAELERRTVQLQVAAEVARDATTARDVGELLNRAVNLIRERFGFYHAGIFLVDERGEYAVLRAATGEVGRQMLERGHKLKVGEVGIVGYAASTGQPHIAPAVDADTVHFKNPLLPETRSEMALPLKVGERVIGALDVQSVQESAFDEDEVAVLQIMADQLAVVIEKARLFERTQAALEERLRTVVSNAPVILYALDREGVLTLSEGKGLEALGLKPGEVVGQSVFDLYHDVPQIVEDVRRALAGEAFVSTVEVNGVILEPWYSPLRDQDGEVTGAIIVATDVTARKHLEEQIRRQDRLAAVGQLAGGIAHDFNNFLTTIILYAQILRGKSHLPPDLVPGLETILDEARRAAQLVRQILDFSRRSPIETQPVDLKPFIEEVIDILRRTLPENIRLLLEIGAEEYVVNADSTRIQQVVMNLAVNARDAMPEGGELRIGLSRMEVRPGEEPPVAEMDAGEWVCLAMLDTGTGIPPDVMPHLFEPFFTTKPVGQGTGLGLAQVYGIVKQHEGRIGVETEAGRGTTFRIYLPAHEAGEEEVSEETAAPPEGKGEIILLVEDEEKVREAGREALETLGYRVLAAANGREALEVYRSAAGVDLVVTDIVMPEMGGKELVRELKKTNPYLKAVAITGHAAEGIQELRKEGILDIIQKPLDVNTLAQVIRRVLDADKTPAERDH